MLFTVSGVLLWLGERDTAWRLPGSIALHDVATLVAGVLVAGHIWMAISPRGLPAIHGILHGTVPAAWAAEHHPKWVADAAGEPAASGARRPAAPGGRGGRRGARHRQPLPSRSLLKYLLALCSFA